MKICLINGHPDPSPQRLCHAISKAYGDAARFKGHDVTDVTLGELEIPFLTSIQDFEQSAPPPVDEVQRAIDCADHLVVVYPLWLGTLPAKLKALLEQVARAGFFLDTGGNSNSWPVKKMKGRSVRLIVTMGMPGFAYRLLFGAHSLKGLEAGVFRMAGFKPVRHTVFGGVGLGEKRCAEILAQSRKLGENAL